MTRTPEEDGPLLDWSLQAARHSPRLYRAMENARTPIVGPGDPFNPKAQNEAVRGELHRLLGHEINPDAARLALEDVLGTKKKSERKAA